MAGTQPWPALLPPPQATHGPQLCHSLCKAARAPGDGRANLHLCPRPAGLLSDPRVQRGHARLHGAQPGLQRLEQHVHLQNGQGWVTHTHRALGMAPRAPGSSHITNSFHLTLSLLPAACESSPNSSTHCPLLPALVAEPHTQLLLDNPQFPTSLHCLLPALPTCSHQILVEQNINLIYDVILQYKAAAKAFSPFAQKAEETGLKVK